MNVSRQGESVHVDYVSKVYLCTFTSGPSLRQVNLIINVGGKLELFWNFKPQMITFSSIISCNDNY